MARFLTRSQLARVTPVLGHHFRSSLGLFSTMPNMKIPAFGNPNKYLKSMEERNEIHRKVEQLAKHVVILSCDSAAKGRVCDVYVVGIFHGSPESCKEIQAIMSYLKPQVLFLELCEYRSYMLQQEEMHHHKYSVMDIGKAVMGKHINITGAIKLWNQQKYKSQMKEFKSEFFVAYQEAIKYGSKVVLGDRLQKITFERLSRKLAIWHKILCFHRLDKDHIKHTYWEVNVDERDKYMAHQLLEVARKNCSVVAIVGKGHLEGMKKYWKQPIDVEDLTSIPPSKSKSSLICVVGAAMVIAIIEIVLVGAKICLEFTFSF